MALKYKLTALAVLALAVVFNQFFMFAKHEPSLAAIIPFADDPYDAVGSMAVIVTALLTILSLFRVFRPRRPESSLAKVLIARVQMAVALAVLVALGSDCVAMARHPSVWTGKPATGELIVLLAGMAVLSLGVLFLIRVSVRGIGLSARQHEWRRAVAVLLVCAAALAFFPEYVIKNVLLHFLTIIAGFVLLAAPQSALTVALLPYATAETPTQTTHVRSRSQLWIQWGAIAILGFGIGAFAWIREAFGEGAGNAPPIQVLVVSSVFIGAGTSALLIAFAFLKNPLGLFRKTSN